MNIPDKNGKFPKQPTHMAKSELGRIKDLSMKVAGNRPGTAGDLIKPNFNEIVRRAPCQ